MGFTGFYRCSLGFLGLLLGILAFYRVLPGFTGFHLVGLESSHCNQGDMVSDLIWQCRPIVGSYCVFYLVLLGFDRLLYRVLSGFYLVGLE